MPADETAAALLEGAREWARSNLTGRVMFAHMPKPAGAERVFGWEDDGDGRWSRRFDGTQRGFQQVSVDIVGVQWADGMVEGYVYIDAHGVELPAAAARDLADSLIAAADELDRQTD